VCELIAEVEVEGERIDGERLSARVVLHYRSEES
jgi:hypothetical protein